MHVTLMTLVMVKTALNIGLMESGITLIACINFTLYVKGRMASENRALCKNYNKSILIDYFICNQVLKTYFIKL